MISIIQQMEFCEGLGSSAEDGLLLENQYEYYCRFCTALLYDLCLRWGDSDRQPADRRAAYRRCLEYPYGGAAGEEEEPLAGLRDLLARLLRELKVTELEDATLQSWLSSYEKGSGEGSVARLFCRSSKAVTDGGYLWYSVYLYRLLQEEPPLQPVLPQLRNMLFGMAAFVAMRGVDAHMRLNDGYYATLRSLRRWLRDRNDPVFGDGACSLLIPIRKTPDGEWLCCQLRPGSLPTQCRISCEKLQRSGLPQENDYLHGSLYLRMDSEGPLQRFCDQYMQSYFRLSPLLTVRRESTLQDYFMRPLTHGIFAHVLRSPNEEYRYFPIYSYDEQPGPVALDELDSRHCFVFRADSRHQSRIPPRANVLLNPGGRGEGIVINESRNPDFVNALNPDRKLVYYPVIRPEDDRKLDGLQQGHSSIHLVFLSGHGGLGKTHLALHLLRDRYMLDLPQARLEDPLPFRQVVFLSAKRERINLNADRLQQDEGMLDIRDYQSLLEQLARNLLTEGDRPAPGDSRALADTLRQNLGNEAWPLLLIVDDLDTLEPQDQQAVCSFLNKVAGRYCRVLVTSRIFTQSVLNCVSNVTSITLEPLEQERSWAFLRTYLTPEGLRDAQLRDGTLTPEHVQQATFGVPLNLAILSAMIREGRGGAGLWSSTAQSVRGATAFVFRNVLTCLSEPTQTVLYTLLRFLRIVNGVPGARERNSLSVNTLRLLTPDLSREEREEALAQLDTYRVICFGNTAREAENRLVTLHMPADSIEIEGLRHPPFAEHLLREVQENAAEWYTALGNTAEILRLLFETMQQWYGAEDDEKRRLAARYAEFVAAQPDFEGAAPGDWGSLSAGAALSKSTLLLKRTIGDPARRQALRGYWDSVFQHLCDCSAGGRWKADLPQSERQLYDLAFDQCLKTLELCADAGAGGSFFGADEESADLGVPLGNLFAEYSAAAEREGDPLSERFDQAWEDWE